MNIQFKSLRFIESILFQMLSIGYDTSIYRYNSLIVYSNLAQHLYCAPKSSLIRLFLVLVYILRCTIKSIPKCQ